MPFLFLHSFFPLSSLLVLSFCFLFFPFVFNRGGGEKKEECPPSHYPSYGLSKLYQWRKKRTITENFLAQISLFYAINPYQIFTLNAIHEFELYSLSLARYFSILPLRLYQRPSHFNTFAQ
ncbi:hypothetical protein HDV63DRAFT_374699 [Trichoderma sp. SZMC 28014]